MLIRIESVKGIGLLHDAKGGALKLESCALIYGGNGRGKSTLASILRSVAKGDSVVVQERTTIDGTIQPEVVLQFDAGHKVCFDNNAWAESRPEIVVYDADFVENNVHSGTEITAEQRKNLLDFALGDSAVKARSDEESATVDQQKATESIRQLSAQIGAHASGLSLPVFRALAPIADVDNRRKVIANRLAAAKSASTILAQPMPDPMPVPAVNVEAVFEVLSRTLDNVHADAESAVSSHLAEINDASMADWLRKGQSFDNQESCPYCGQDTHGVSLIQMYQSYFNAAYEELRLAIESVANDVSIFTDALRFREFVDYRSGTNERLTQWAPYVDVSLLEIDQDELAETSLENLRELLVSLLSRKSVALTVAVGTQDDLEEAIRLWGQYAKLISDSHEVVVANRERISEYKSALQSEDSAKIEMELSQLDLNVARHTEPVMGLVQKLVRSETVLKDSEMAKKAARSSLTAQMTETLTKYRADINKHLSNLGALFAIDEIKTNFLGSSPRTDFGISLRGKSVKLTGGSPSFATALSDGDKRTMALAFFVASTLADPLIGEKIIVFDDPMSSLDKSRREYTIELLLTIAEQSSQLIVLAHDALFLRDLRKALLRRDGRRAVSTMQICRTAADYSDFDSIDLDRECESPYYTHYRAVCDFVEGTTTDHKAAAVAMRPLMEGYLHRKYPGRIGSDLMLGTAIDQIDNAPSNSPLFHAKAKVAELKNLNVFAGKFHHDTNPDLGIESPDPQSVATYGKRVLDLIHGAT